MGKFFIAYTFAMLFAKLVATDFVVGTTSGYAPYVSLDEKGQYVGFDIDIAKELSKKINRTLVIKDLGSMPALMLALRQGKIDAIIWAISITQERQKQMEMVYYQGEKVSSLPLLFWKKIPENISSIEDMVGDPKAVICVETGSFQESVLQKMNGLSLKNVDKVTDALLEIRYGKSQATMVDPSLLAKLKAQCPELAVLSVPLAPSDTSLGNGICLNKNNCILRDQIQKGIADMQSDGTIKELERKWNLVGVE